MRRVLRAFVGAAVSLCLVGGLVMAGASAKGPSSKGTPITVGDFALNLARAMNLKAPAGGFTAESAKKALGDLGIAVRSPLPSDLSEGELVEMLRGLGVNLRTADPLRSVTIHKANSVVATFQGELRKAALLSGVAAANGGDDFNNGNGKGGKFKRKANLSPGVPPGQTD